MKPLKGSASRTRWTVGSETAYTPVRATPAGAENIFTVDQRRHGDGYRYSIQGEQTVNCGSFQR